MLPYFRIKRLKNHTLWRCTYLYSQYKGIPPASPPPTPSTCDVKLTTLQRAMMIRFECLLVAISGPSKWHHMWLQRAFNMEGISGKVNPSETDFNYRWLMILRLLRDFFSSKMTKPRTEYQKWMIYLRFKHQIYKFYVAEGLSLCTWKLLTRDHFLYGSWLWARLSGNQ